MGDYMNELKYKCYNTQEGCMGLIKENEYQLFASESDYKDWYETTQKNTD